MPVQVGAFLAIVLALYMKLTEKNTLSALSKEIHYSCQQDQPDASQFR